MRYLCEEIVTGEPKVSPPEVININLGDGRIITAKLIAPGKREVYLSDEKIGSIAKGKIHWTNRLLTDGFRIGVYKNRETAVRDLIQRYDARKAEANAAAKSKEEAKKARSEPLPKGPDMTGNPKFMEWFAGSVIVDDDGKPMRVYRGARSEEVRFSAPSFTNDPDIAGIYAAEPGSSMFFGPSGAEFVEGSHVGAYYLSIKNPVVFKKLLISDVNLKTAMPGITDEDIENINKDLRNRKGPAYKQTTRSGVLHTDAYAIIDTKVFVEIAKRLGFDGVVHKDTFQAGKQESQRLLGKPGEHLHLGRHDTHITFRPFSKNQIKSAIGNKGTFAKDSEDIKEWWKV